MKTNLAQIAVSLGFILAACDPGEISYPEEVADGDGKPQPAQARPLPEDDCYLGEMRECDGGEGTQFCDLLEGGQGWGECLVDFVCMPGDTKECIGDSVTCYLEEGVPTWPMCPFTPLVLSFEVGTPVEMLASEAAFDIAGVGECLDSDWPSAATPWLAADLDRNGSIDAGNELFGSGTILASGQHAKNGFVALAPFDGNHDGRISSEDPRFSELLVWRDEDADKLSLPYELTSLAEAGVQMIDLDYHVLEQCDERGNCGRERSRFSYVGSSGQTSVGEVVDMYLACE